MKPKSWKVFAVIVLFFLLLPIIIWVLHELLTRQQAMLNAPYAAAQLQSYFRREKVNYPPQQLAFLVFKNTKQLEIYAKDAGQWHYIRSFPILAASGHSGPKLREGDLQVPEGIYHIAEFYPQSPLVLSMRIDYPNTFDLAMAKIDHRTDLGGDICIHGVAKSTGCLGIGNNSIKQLFPLVYFVGRKNTLVIIAPNDLRKENPQLNANLPSWTPKLYRQLKNSLRVFPIRT